MTEETLRHRVERHNSVQLLTAIVLFSGAAVFWWLSFWIFRGLMCSGRRSRTATN